MPDAPSGISGIDVAGATAAIEEAGGLGTVMGEETGNQYGTATPPVSTQDQGSTDQLRDPVSGRWVRPGGEVTQTPAQEIESEAFTNVDPNSLPPELQGIYKSLQADYTRKTQEIAPLRRLSEQLGGEDNLLEAARVYESLQNPAYWPQLYGELKDGMEQLGLSPAQAHEAASQEVARQQSHEQGPFSTNNQGFDWSDPDYAPIKELFDGLSSEVTGLKNSLEQRQAQEQQERLQMAIVGEMQRQENLIRQMNPSYQDDDIAAIYELSSYHGGNLLDAQSRYEEIATSRLERFLAAKQSAVGSAGIHPVSGGDVISSEGKTFANLDEAHTAALEALRNIEAAEL